MLASELEKNSDSFSPEPIRSMHSPPAVVRLCSVALHEKTNRLVHCTKPCTGIFDPLTPTVAIWVQL